MGPWAAGDRLIQVSRGAIEKDSDTVDLTAGVGVFRKDEAAKLDTARMIHVQGLDGGAADRSETLDFAVHAGTKVGAPIVAAGMEEFDDLAGPGVDAGEIRAFGDVTAVAGEGEVIEFIGTAVDGGDDVLDVMGEKGVALVDAAILAAEIGAKAHFPLPAFDHCPCARWRVLSLRMEMTSAELM